MRAIFVENHPDFTGRDDFFMLFSVTFTRYFFNVAHRHPMCLVRRKDDLSNDKLIIR
jgi:hypothetical protein